MTVTESTSAVFVSGGYHRTPQRSRAAGLVDPASGNWPSPGWSNWCEYVEASVNKSLYELKEDWDGMGADKPTPIAAHMVVEVALVLQERIEDRPDVIPTSDGGFALEWPDGPLIDLLVEVGPKGDIDVASRSAAD